MNYSQYVMGRVVKPSSPCVTEPYLWHITGFSRRVTEEYGSKICLLVKWYDEQEPVVADFEDVALV
jgi:hypothetical protein